MTTKLPLAADIVDVGGDDILNQLLVRRPPRTTVDYMRDLLARDQIRDLVALYAHRAVHGWSLAELFTRDGVYGSQFPGQAAEIVRSREAIEEYFVAYFASLGKVQRPFAMIHNLRIEVNGDTAIGICSNEIRANYQGQSIVAYGYLSDRYRREEETWKFASRFMTFMKVLNGG